MNLFDITGKKAIVTGAAQGLSKGMAEGLMEAGVEVTIFDIADNTKEVAAEFLEKGFKCHGVKVDIGNKEDREKAFKEAVANMGGINILVNGAGVQRRHKVEEFPLEDWDLVIDINMTAPFALCQLAAREFLKTGGGKIVNIASMLTYFGGFTVPAYAASKGGVAQFTKAFSNELAGKNININAIAPGYMDTDMNINIINDPGRYNEITNRIPAGRWGTSEDMKGIVVFLSSPASDYLNGAIIPVDGGYLNR